jgi:serine/threonine protein kinase
MPQAKDTEPCETNGNPQAVDLAAFLEPLLRFDADERPSAREALAHPWLLRQER